MILPLPPRQAYLVIDSKIVITMPDTRTQILDIAERAIRQRGYHAFSFRDISDDLGIKSASIHYHFRHKQDLGHAVVDRYATRIAENLGPAGQLDWPASLQAFCQVYQDALETSGVQCLCGMLAAESTGLPDNVSSRVAQFYENNIEWLMAAMPASIQDKRATALRIQSQLQGAMTVSVSMGDRSILDGISKQLISSLD
ncbi:MAG: TetR family transcriptional regulator [Boseongicola sp.]|nr:MAG: TetR family transcriptional regulator [Boseongicola sp.]